MDRRWIINAILYVVRTGCPWRQLPRDFPHGETVYTVFWRWSNQGVWQKIHDALRDQLRRVEGKRRKPTVAILDSQSVRTAEGGDARGGLPQWLRKQFGWTLQTVRRPVQAKGFVALPKRRIVEWTFAWLVRHRRHARDYEQNTQTSEAMIHITMISLMARRPARKI